MTLRGCPRENEVRDLIARSQWPVGAELDLRNHLVACRSCSDLALVADAFQKARAATVAAARPGSAGALWWRAHLRRRNAAVERITKPLLGAEVFALTISVLAGLAFLVFEARSGVAWLTWLEGLPQVAVVHWQSLLATSAADPTWTWMLLLPAALSLALLGGVAVYLASERQ
jgi:hypothetical protein